MKFWILWGFDALIAAVPIYFFLVGLYDGSVSSFNIKLWLALLFVLAAILVGSPVLRAYGHIVAAWVVLAAMAIPGFLGGLFFLALVLLKPRWN